MTQQEGQQIFTAKLAEAYKSIGNFGEAEKISHCGRRPSEIKLNDYKFFKVVVDENKHTGRYIGDKPYTCRNRLCPRCNGDKTFRNYDGLKQLIMTFNNSYPEYTLAYIKFITRGFHSSELRDGIDFVHTSFSKWRRSKSKDWQGYFRVAAITYDSQSGLYFVTIHALVALSDGTDKTIRKCQEWWHTCCGQNYLPQCDCILLSEPGVQEQAAMNIAKCSSVIQLGDFVDLMTEDEEKFSEVIGVITKAVTGRRMTETGGLMRGITF